MKQTHKSGFLTFLTHPNFLVLFLTGIDNQPSSLDSVIETCIKEYTKHYFWDYFFCVHFKSYWASIIKQESKHEKMNYLTVWDLVKFIMVNVQEYIK